MNVAPVGKPSSWIGSEGRSVAANLVNAIIIFRRSRLHPQVPEHLDPAIPRLPELIFPYFTACLLVPVKKNEKFGAGNSRRGQIITSSRARRASSSVHQIPAPDDPDGNEGGGCDVHHQRK